MPTGQPAHSATLVPPQPRGPSPELNPAVLAVDTLGWSGGLGLVSVVGFVGGVGDALEAPDVPVVVFALAAPVAAGSGDVVLGDVAVGMGLRVVVVFARVAVVGSALEPSVEL